MFLVAGDVNAWYGRTLSFQGSLTIRSRSHMTDFSVTAIRRRIAGASQQAAFTLLEMAVVLVIIGLIVGGVLVGQDLIKAAQVRAEISQIEKYNTAANAFRGKFGYLPGDLPAAPALRFGFAARGTAPGEGDGNGIIQGIGNPSSAAMGNSQTGEPLMFWVDLSTAGLIDGGFNTATPTTTYSGLTLTSTSTPSMTQLLPPAKIAPNATYVYVWSGGYGLCDSCGSGDGQNYFSIGNTPDLSGWGPALLPEVTSYNLSVAQAYNIDVKVDDGLPQSGRVLAFVPVDQYAFWTGSTGGSAYTLGASYTTATAGSNSSCFDNSTSSSGTPGVAGNAQHYSMEISNGAYTNCGLSFKMQAGD